MKKLNLMKLALTFGAAFMFISANAQTNTGSTQWSVAGGATVGDYIRAGTGAGAPITNAADPLVTAPTDKITINKSLPFFVWPSAVYNPNFDYTTIGTGYSTILQTVTNVSSSFAWSSVSGTITTFDGTGISTVVPPFKNYAEISYATTGNKVVSVVETPSSGICPGVAVYMGVQVIDVPSVTITSAAGLGLTRVIKSGCWAAAGQNQSQIPFVINNANEAYNYHFRLAYKIYNVNGLDGSGNLPVIAGDLDAASSTLLAYDNKINGSVVAGTPTAANPIVVTAGLNMLPAITDFEVKNSKITVYEFDLAGYNAKISRKSDYRALRNGALSSALYENYSIYGTAGKYYVVALPTPVTGPIYYIPNTFGL